MPPNDTGNADDAVLPFRASPATPLPQMPLNTAPDTFVTGGASDAKITALADDLAYTLTAEQAREKYAEAKRKVPSLRTIQRYCDEGRIAAQKIRTTYGAEWLINEASLVQAIAAEPVVAGDAPPRHSRKCRSTQRPTPSSLAAPATPSSPTNRSVSDDASLMF